IPKTPSPKSWGFCFCASAIDFRADRSPCMPPRSIFSAELRQKRPSLIREGLFYCCKRRNDGCHCPVSAKHRLANVQTSAKKPPIMRDSPRYAPEWKYFTALQANFGDPDLSTNW
ncbi:hypothetical protein, partial [Cupriavidus sp. BIS7]|uniref:hypothetical protein n=1 Tax=Cupriavidus sp. BIS7 TaxID=1217718 RepID=UPI001ED96114